MRVFLVLFGWAVSCFGCFWFGVWQGLRRNVQRALRAERKRLDRKLARRDALREVEAPRITRANLSGHKRAR